MHSLFKNLSTTLTITVMMFVTSFQAMADDTEIFFSSVSLNGATTIQPNVLLVLDTSSSMTTQVGTTGMNRLEHMKSALHTILDTTNNINVGLMRFHRKGGPVLFPVADINADVDTVLGTASLTPQTFNRIDIGDDDVEEAGGTVDASNSELIIGNTSGATLLACGDPGTTTISIPILDNEDDVEEESDGNINETSTDLDLGKEHVGLYFENINVPLNATIHCAEIDFEVDDKISGDTDVSIAVQDIGNALAFDTGNSNDLTSRFSGTEASVAWDNIPNQNQNTTLTSPDIASLIQGLVDRTDWVAGNNAVVKISGSGHKDMKSHNHSGGGEPVLRISYTNVAGGAGVVNKKVGLRFTDVKIPQGSTITAAYLDFTSANATNSDVSTVEIYAENVDDSAAFATGATNDVSNRKANVTTNSPVTWSVPTWNPSTLYTSPDIKAIVQDIVSRSNWCGGNAMTFLLNSTAGTRKAVSDNGNSSVSPALRIEYDETTAVGCNTQLIQAQVATDDDDAEEFTSGSNIGNMVLNSSDLELHADGSIEQLVGLRFQNINVTSTDTITSAEIEFTVDDDDTDTSATSLTIYGEYTGNAQVFSSSNKISTRTRTTASVNWTPGSWSTSGIKHVTPDVSAIVQEIVGHSGWSALNEMAFIIEGSSGERTAESHDGSPINAPILRINVTGSGLGNAGSGSITVRDRMHEIVDQIQWKSGTPIVDSLYEAGLYYRGDGVLFGRTRGGGAALSPLSESIGSRSEYTRVSHEASYTGSAPTRDNACSADNLTHPDCVTERIEGTATYNSPIELECQDNHIVLLSDGSPSQWNLNETSTHYFNKAACDTGTSNGRCGPEIANFLHNNDQIDDSDLGDDQKVTTHTIGFNFAGSTYLQDIASEGGGGFYEASTASQLATVFSQIFADVLQSPTSFVAPAVTINTFNRLSHRDELYFALFEPDDKPRWAGNLKRYKLDSSGASPIIVDYLAQPAVSSVTGFFSSSAQSWWSGLTDGEDIRKGGFAGEVGTTRNIFTYTGTNSTLSDSSNALIDSNSSLTDAMLNIVTENTADPTYRPNLLSWIGGVDVLDEDEDNSTSDARKFIGDPLHSRPALVTYGGTASMPDTTAYFGTNEGFIHAVNVETGAELFSFMPAEVLSNIKLLYANQGTPADHYYGIDGTITPWVNDANHDNDLLDAGDHVYLYAGMRRGGNNYYALDATTRSSPSLLWTIQGGSGNFAELGQTWSQPVKTKVDIGGTTTDVLIFAGGYDANQDNAATPQNDNIGRALYIVNATTGARLWWAGPAGSGADLEVTNLNNSMPAKPAVVDLNVDGIADHVYIGDLGGRVWRFDFTNGNTASTFGSATLLATLGDTDADATNDIENNRRFYHTPSVALKDPLSSHTAYVTLGSGFHAHPLNQDTHDRFYVLEDTDVLNAGSMTLPLTQSVLYDSTNNVIQDGATPALQAAAQVARAAAPGWYLRLEEDSATQIGEKALSRATIFDGVLLFSTYLPEDPSGAAVAAACQAAAGAGRTYALNLDDGSSVFNFDTTVSALNKTDRYVKLHHVGIPPEVQVIIPAGSLSQGKKPILLVGTEIIQGADFGKVEVDSIYWSDQP